MIGLHADETAASCRRCSVIRWFLMVSGALIGAMLFLPSQAAGLGPVLPPPAVFGFAVPLFGIPVFVLRLVRWRRDGRP